MRKTATGICLVLLLSWALAGAVAASQSVQIQDVRGGLRLMDQQRDRVNVQVDVGSISFLEIQTKEGLFNQLVAEGLAPSNDVGAPSLPVSNRLIAVPQGATVRAEVVSSEVEEISLNDYDVKLPLMPAQPSLSKSDDPMSVPFAFNQDIYTRAAFYSQPRVQTKVLGSMRGVRIGSISISPFEYNPVENVLRVHKNMKIEVVFENADWNRTENVYEKLYSPAFKKMHDLTINSGAMLSGAKDDLTSYPVKYLIISDPAFETALQPLVEWKTKKGFEVVEAYTDVIGTSSSAIKSYIEGVFDADTAAGNPPPSFILLCGDAAEIPPFDSEFGHGHITDLYYGEMDGGGDYFPDIYYGRFSAKEPSHIETQVAKTLEYEQYLMPDPSYLENVTLVSGYDGSHAQTWGNGQINYGTNYYFNAAHGITANVWLFPNDGDEYSAEIIQTVSDGVSFYNYTAHCGHSGMGTPSFETGDLPGLADNHTYLLGVGNCCESNTFASSEPSDAFGEAFLKTEDKGGIGWIGATNSTYWDEDYWWGVGSAAVSEPGPTYEASTMGAYDGVFHDHGEPTSEHYVTNAAMNVAGCLGVTDGGSRVTYYWEAYTLMGDPSVMTYMGIPTTNSIVHDATCLMTETSFTVSADPGSYVGITLDGVLQGAAYVDASGTVDVPLVGFAAPGVCDIVVTCQFRQPYISTFQVISPSGPYVIHESNVVNDATGNNNAQIDFGEDILLGVTLQNVGPDTAYGVEAALTTTDGYVTITDGAETYGTIDPDMATKYIADAFAFSVDPLIPDGHWIEFELEMTGADTWYSTVRLQAHAPNVGLLTFTVDDAAAGNGNGKLDPGETADLILTLQNNGTGQVFNAEAYISTSDTYVTIDDDYGTFGVIDGSGGTADNSGNVYKVTADPGCPQGHAAGISIAMTGDGGYAANMNMSMTVGDRVVFFYEDFSTDQGWTGYGGDAEWERAAAGGLQDDPADDHTPGTSNWVLGNDLTGDGDYNSGITETHWITSPMIDCSEKTSVKMVWAHWWGCESNSYDHIYFQVFDGENWVTLLENEGTFQADSWTVDSLDLSAYADNNPGFQIRYGLGGTDGGGTYSGWNIDDIELRGYSGSGAPDMSMDPMAIVDSLQPNGTSSETITISNNGDGNLGIWFTTNDPWIEITYGKLTIAPGEFGTVDIGIDCSGMVAGDHVGTLTYTSNDASMPDGSIPVNLHIYAPDMSLSETEIIHKVGPGETDTHQLTITNNGEGTLLYSVSCTMDPVKDATGVVAASDFVDPIGYRPADPDKTSGVQEGFFAPVTKGTGGPDVFGHNWFDSDEPGGPVFDWVDISSVGTPVTGLTDDGGAGPFDLGFLFPFFDSTYSQVYMSSNGLLTFDQNLTSGTVTNYTMPYSSFATAMIAMWWDDLDPPEAGTVYTYQDAANGRFILTFDGIRNYSYPEGTGSLTFQAILYANGRITLQYLEMDPGADSDGLAGATIGFQNSDRDDGLTIVHNAEYMHDNLAIDIIAASWLSVETTSGSIEPYGSEIVTLNFDATEMEEEGLFTGSVAIGCNDPFNSSVTIPVTMDVSSGCCVGRVGNIDGGVDETPGLGDLTVLIDHMFVTYTDLVCYEEGDLDLSAQPGDPGPPDITLGDLTLLIDHLYVTFNDLPLCP